MAEEPAEEIDDDYRGGDCFRVAAETLDVYLGRGEVHLVHGLPRSQVLRDGRGIGRRYWHAWVEIRRSGRDYVVDGSNGRMVFLDRDRYYRMRFLTQWRKGGPRLTFRYTPEQARELLLKWKNYGPWVDGWEEMAEA